MKFVYQIDRGSEKSFFIILETMRDVFWIFHRIIVQCSTGVKTESEITVKENLGRYTRCSLVTTLCRLKCVMCAAWQRYSKARSTPVTMSKQHCRMLER